MVLLFGHLTSSASKQSMGGSWKSTVIDDSREGEHQSPSCQRSIDILHKAQNFMVKAPLV